MGTNEVAIIGAPVDLGAGRRGVDMGPSALRVANINARIAMLGYKVTDLDNIPVSQPESLAEGHLNARYLAEIAQACRDVGERVYGALTNGQLPLVLGGDHSVSAGTVAGAARFHRERGNKIGLLWVDAHTDMNTPATSPSGNVHGMPLAALLGLGPPELSDLFGFAPKVEARNVAVVGIRSIDEEERGHVRQSGARIFTMRDVDEHGMRAVMQQALDIVRDGTTCFHVSLDMDAVDPQEAPGVGTAVRGGLSYREAHLAMEIIHDQGCMSSLEIVEVNPVLDDANRTAQLAVELAMSALGKRIL